MATKLADHSTLRPPPTTETITTSTANATSTTTSTRTIANCQQGSSNLTAAAETIEQKHRHQPPHHQKCNKWQHPPNHPWLISTCGMNRKTNCRFCLWSEQRTNYLIVFIKLSSDQVVGLTYSVHHFQPVHEPQLVYQYSMNHLIFRCQSTWQCHYEVREHHKALCNPWLLSILTIIN